ncbi:zinc protease [Rhizomicrobium palustre]|uniref:Zinc protease n=1 Tax=Rhizomicrobium palustre TaxID=189966 RepID=A0A846MZH5_9PROT|nr:M16 family metallopeptidase [Rhizomicrobium palustre]NIK88501.1 zinc protease [Rhizomicrobium palustre]
MSGSFDQAKARAWRLDAAALLPMLHMAWHREVLANGLTVIVHSDPLVPMVYVDLTYRVGAMDEPRGKTGLSHLFEHLMFTGTDRFPENYSTRMQEAGAVMVNAMTSHNLTRYYQTAPAAMLDFILQAEADRMENFVPSLTHEKLEQQRAIVLEEKSETEGKPYGKINIWMAEGLLPAGHPRHHPIIGYADDVKGVTLEVAREWGAKHYTPANAVLVISGGVDVDAAIASVKRFFGPIEPGRASEQVVARSGPWQPASALRAQAAIEVPGRLYACWSTPSVCTEGRDNVALELAARLLADKAGPLHKYFVEERGVAAGAGAVLWPGRGCGNFIVDLTLKAPGTESLSEDVSRVITQWLENPIPDGQFQAIRTACLAQSVAALESFERKARLLQDGEVFHGDAGWFLQEGRILAELTEEDVRSLAKRWLRPEFFSLFVDAAPKLSADGAHTDDKVVSFSLDNIAARPPQWQEAVLACGARIRLVRRPGDASFHLRAIGKGGIAAEPRGKEGIATLAASALQFGAGPDDGKALAARLSGSGLNARLSAAVSAQQMDISGTRPALHAAIALLADVIQEPHFYGEDFERQRSAMAGMAETRAQLARQKAMRAQFAALLGNAHRLASAWPTSPELARSVSTQDVLSFHESAFDPSHTVFFLAADIELDSIVGMLNAAFSAPRHPVSGVAASEEVGLRRQGGIYLFDAPGSTSVEIAARWLMRPRNADVEAAALAFMEAFCGSFTSRANQRIREELRWSYGVTGQMFQLFPRDHLRLCTLDTTVAVPQAAASIGEIETMLSGFRQDLPPTQGEIDRFRRSERQRLARMSETPIRAIEAMEDMYYRGVASGDLSSYVEALEALDTGRIMALSDAIMPAGGELVWTVIGDAAIVGPQLADAGYAVGDTAKLWGDA